MIRRGFSFGPYLSSLIASHSFFCSVTLPRTAFVVRLELAGKLLYSALIQSYEPSKVCLFTHLGC